MIKPDCGPLCDETLRQVERFIDGEIEASASTVIERHLSDCNPCLEKVEFRRQLKHLVQRSCAEEQVPPTLTARISEILDKPYDSSDPD